jgi:site-specific recombinase XerD
MDNSQQTIEQFANSMRAQGKQPATIESYCRDAKRFLAYLADQGQPPLSAQAENLNLFQKHVLEIDSGKENSVRRAVIGVRQFYRYLADSKQIMSSPFDDVAIPQRNESLPDKSRIDNVAKLLEVRFGKAQQGLRFARDTAILALLALEGLKTSELISLDWADFVFGVDGATVRVAGTRNRIIELCPQTVAAVLHYKDYILTDARFVKADLAKAKVFVAFKGRDSSIPLPKMTRHGLKFIIYEIGESFGLKYANAELLRHHAVEYQLASGKAPEQIMQHFGLRRLGNIKKHAAILTH